MTTDNSAAIQELALAPKAVSTDEGRVEERSIKEMIEADMYAQNQGAPEAPLHGLRVSRCKPSGPV